MKLTLGKQVIASEDFPRLPISEVLGYHFSVPLEGGLRLLHKSVTGAEELGQTEKYAFIPPRRPLTLLDIIPRTPTLANSVLYVQQTSFAYVATPVAHTIRKPETAATYAQQTANVTTVATWIPVTTPMFSDAVGLEASLDTLLVQALNVELETQILTGTGTAPDLLGILNTPGISTYTPPPAEPALAAVRRAATMTVLNGEVAPTAVVLHPTDLESLELTGGIAGGTSGTFGGDTFGGGTSTIYSNLGLPWSLADLLVVQTPSMPQGTGLLGAFDVGCMLFDRQRGRVNYGTMDDNFVRNIQVVRAELETAFAVLRPAAFTKITF